MNDTNALAKKLLEEQFWNTYYRQDVLALAESYPTESSIEVDACDLYRFEPALVDDLRDNFHIVVDALEQSLAKVDLPVDIDISGATVRITDTEQYLERKRIGEIGSDDLTHFLALRCQIGQVTGVMDRIQEAAFECLNCQAITVVPQGFIRFQEPRECSGCDRDGPYEINYAESEYIDQRKVRLEQPPEEQVNGSNEEEIGYVLGDLVDYGGEHGLQDKAGSRCTVFGELKVDDSELYGRGQTEPVTDRYFVVHNILFDDEIEDEINVEEYRDEIESYASRDDAIDVFRQSIDPGLTMTQSWHEATEMATAWLFAAPRIDPDDGDMVRGDLHMLFVSDPGMRKSVFAENLAELSPQCEIREATGMSSDVGLTSAAQQDDFGEGKWTLEPGALPRANGGHMILDEIDKGPGLGGIHGALEGEQELKVDKAGIQANLATRVGFLALGNPVEGRFDKYEPIAEQIDLDPALMSRFDLVITMQDSPDESVDTDIADGILESIDESARIEYGDLEPQEADKINPDVPRDVMKAWVKLARNEINPMLTPEAKEILSEFYVDTRQLNDDSDTPPATARTLVAGVRIAMAFARVELSETVEEHHAQRAVELSKTVVGENYDPETGLFDADRTTETPSTQQQRVDSIKQVLRNAEDNLTAGEIAEKTGIDVDTVEHRIEKLRNKNPSPIIEPVTGEYALVG